GITMAMAMYSAVSGIKASNDVAMTGEFTLRGKVLPIGGLMEKLLAAKRNDISTVLIPAGNEIDLKEIPDKVKEGLKIIPMNRIEDAIPYVFADPNSATKKRSKKKKAEMSETILIERDLSVEETYKQLIPQIKSLLAPSDEL